MPFETNIAARHKYKEDKYAHFLSDITRKKCSLICWEIGTRGLFTDENVARLRKIHSLTDKLVKQTVTEIVYACSYYIFAQRGNPTCVDIPPLSVS